MKHSPNLSQQWRSSCRVLNIHSLTSTPIFDKELFTPPDMVLIITSRFLIFNENIFNTTIISISLTARGCNENKGLKEGRTACCGTGKFRGTFSCGGKRPAKEYEVCEEPREYVFWDSYHLTQTVYQQMAYQMWSGKRPTTGPYNLKTMFQCRL